VGEHKAQGVLGRPQFQSSLITSDQLDQPALQQSKALSTNLSSQTPIEIIYTSQAIWPDSVTLPRSKLQIECHPPPSAHCSSSQVSFWASRIFHITNSHYLNPKSFETCQPYNMPQYIYYWSWTCHACHPVGPPAVGSAASGMLTTTTPHCVECSHLRCTNCLVTEHKRRVKPSLRNSATEITTLPVPEDLANGETTSAHHPIATVITAQYGMGTENSRISTTGDGNIITAEDTNPPEPDAINDLRTDSGYQTGIGTETASVMSCDSNELWPDLSLNVLHDLITKFTNILLESPHVSDWACAAAAVIPSHTMEMKVAGLLKNYTQELLPLAGTTQDSKNKAEACLFIRRNKHRIGRCFTEKAATKTTADMFDRLKSLSSDISLEDKMFRWRSASEFLREETNEDSDDDENQLPIEFSDAKEFLISFPPFRRLLERLQALYYDRDERVSTIRNIMTGHLDLSPQEPDYVAIFEMHWDLLSFMKTQYKLDNNVKLGSVITISGSALYCQATTSTEYLRQNWSGYGPEMLGVIQAALDSPNLAAKGILLVVFQIMDLILVS